MARNLNVYGIVIQFLSEANMILTSSQKLDEMPSLGYGLLISAHGEGKLHSHPMSKFSQRFLVHILPKFMLRTGFASTGHNTLGKPGFGVDGSFSTQLRTNV